MEKASQNSINDLMEKFNRRSSPDRKNDQKQNNRKKKTAINTKKYKTNTCSNSKRTKKRNRHEKFTEYKKRTKKD